MIQDCNANIYSFSDIAFVENLSQDTQIMGSFKPVGWIIDFALDNSIKINGIAITGRHLMLSRCDGKDRTIAVFMGRNTNILSIHIHENPYEISAWLGENGQKLITETMVFPILKIISILKNGDSRPVQKMTIKNYVRLLTFSLGLPFQKRSAMNYFALRKIFLAIEGLKEIIRNFPLPSELALKIGVDKTAFQKGCLILYGQTAQRMIHQFKMNQAFKMILVDRKSIDDTSDELGYRYSANFITAFHHHFGVTPVEAVQLLNY